MVVDARRYIALVLILSASLPTAWTAETTRITLGSGSSAGLTYIYGVTLSKIINEKMSGVLANAEATGGNVENIRLVQTKQVTIANAPAEQARQALEGKRKFQPHPDIRAVMPTFPAQMNLVVLFDSPIKGWPDIKGKRLVIGPPGSGAAQVVPQVLSALGISMSDFQPYHISLSEGVDRIVSGQLDGIFFFSPPPTSAGLQLATRKKIRLVPLSEAEIRSILTKYPGVYWPQTILKDTYPGVGQEVKTVGFWYFWITHRDTPEDLIYRITKAYWENLSALVKAHNSAKFLNPSVVKDAFSIPLHPGAWKYYQEIKAPVSADLAPPRN